ncbi:MAG: hypothetical protein EPO40_27115 [Myxococcaceae bacterium]|nr:MAG: hypothetical protein EPO40_27115 [Myxococcaceae bacterium]
MRRFAQTHRLALLTAVGAAAALIAVGQRTPADVDEGFYAIAAELVAHGRLPYRDYFYPQAPYLPFLLAPVAALASRFVIERVVFSLLGAITAGLIAHGVKRDTDSGLAAVTAAALFTLNELTWQWFPSIRPYAPAALCIVGATLLVSAPKRPSLARAALAGALAGVVGGLRLLLLPFVGAIVAAVWLRGARFALLRALAVMVLMRVTLWAPGNQQLQTARWTVPLALLVVAAGPAWRERAKRGALSLAGAIAALLPLAALFRMAPEGFLFGNLAFHANRVTGTWAADQVPWWAQRSTYIHGLFGIVSMNHLSAFAPELIVLSLLSGFALLARPARQTIAPSLAAASVVLAALVPFPVIEHYFTPAVPVLALLAGLGLGHLDRALRGPLAPRLALPVCLLALHLVIGYPSFHRRWREGLYGDFRLHAFRPRRLDYAAARVRMVAERHPGPVLALWPGSALGLGPRMLPGTENHFARQAPLPLGDAALRDRLHIATADDVRDAVIAQTPSVVTIDREVEHMGVDEFRVLLERCGYRVESEARGVLVVYARVEAPGDECSRAR